MTTVTNIYEKIFSEIFNIQEAEEISYNLCTSHSKTVTTYGVELISKKGKGSQTCTLSSISTTKKLVLEILTFLYENSVKPDSAPGVISDIFNL